MDHGSKVYVPEIFGPTIQGEGALVGQSCHFIRVGGCDYNCSWCDSMHAVDGRIFNKAERLTQHEIAARVRALPFAPWVVLSGGNPALFDFRHLINELHDSGFEVQAETQGSRWQDWFNDLDCLALSPKPPSSNMKFDQAILEGIVGRLTRYVRDETFLKVPVLTEEDLEFALDVWDVFAGTDYELPLFVSVVALPNEKPDDVLRRTTKVVGWFRQYDPKVYRNVRIFPQQHFLLWGHEKGR
jgi:7-carboxy-7-deazaguanine synthase